MLHPVAPQSPGVSSFTRVLVVVVLLALLSPALIVGGGLWFALRVWLAPRKAHAV